jgi:hypothetical protein
MYEIIYSNLGKVNSIKRLSDSTFIPLCEGNTDYQDFLKWNKAQKVPLDLNSTIEVVKPTSAVDKVAELTTKVGELETRLTKLEGV